MLAQVVRWTLLLCVASTLLNILMYLGSGNRGDLTNLLGDAGLGILVLFGFWFTRKRR